MLVDCLITMPLKQVAQLQLESEGGLRKIRALGSLPINATSCVCRGSQTATDGLITSVTWLLGG